MLLVPVSVLKEGSLQINVLTKSLKMGYFFTLIINTTLNKDDKRQ